MSEELLRDAITRLAQGLARLAVTAPAGTRWPHHTLPNDGSHNTYAIVGFEGGNVVGGGNDPESARAALACALVHHVTGEECSPCMDCGDPVGGDYSLCYRCIVKCMRPL